MTDVSVIIPTLNEAGNVDAVISGVMDSARRSTFDLEVVVVDDGSIDGTRERVRCWEGLYPVRLVVRDGKRGLASAVQAGARAAKGDVLVVMDADLSHEPEAIARLVEPVMAGACDMVIGSRYAPGGATPGWSLSRRLSSRLATALAGLFTDVRDPLSGFFAVRRELLLNLHGDVTGFKIGLEILARGSGSLQVLETPIIFHKRRQGGSKLSLPVVLDYLRQLKDLADDKSLPRRLSDLLELRLRQMLPKTLRLPAGKQQ
jgi:dolichol-phosphate mannosyltransferase